MILKTFLYTDSNFTIDTTLYAPFSVRTLINSIDFDAVEPKNLVRLKPILDQGADIRVYARYVESILNKKDKALNSILAETWTRLGSNVLKLPIRIHEKSIENNPEIFEKTVLSTLLLWQVEDLVDVCSKSELIFQTCSSIFNELLIKLNFTDKFMEFLKQFVNGVSNMCEYNNHDIIDAYPIKFRSILILRAIGNKDSSLVSKHYLNEEVKKLALNFPKESVCLLSHFPDLCVAN